MDHSIGAEFTADDCEQNQKMPALLSSLIDSDNMEEYFSAWLQILSMSIPSFFQGLIFVSSKESENSFMPVSMWPLEGNEPERILEVTEKSLRDNCGLVVKLKNRDKAQSLYYAVSLPVNINGKDICAVSLEVGVKKENELKEIMEQLQWSVAWLEVFFRREIMKSEDLKIARMKSALDLMASLQSKKKWKEAAVGFVTELSVIMDCDRISMGFVHGSKVKIRAISNSAIISKKMNLVLSIEEVMHEAVMMKREVVFPIPEDEKNPYIVRMHEALSNQFNHASILTLPFFYQGKYKGVLTLERSQKQQFNKDDINYCKGIVSLVFPALLEKKANDRSIFIKILHSFLSLAGNILGNRYIGIKLLTIFLIVSGYFLFTMEGQYRLSADSVLESKTRQVVAVPFNGYIKDSGVTPGDTVNKGDLLCKLDDRDLVLEKMNYLSQRVQLEQQYQNEKAKYNQAEAKVIQARIGQTNAQIEQVLSHIKRTKILSPLKGVVVNGDLTRRLGGFLEQGESIFEIAPLDQYQVILKIDESRINDVKIGLKGLFVLFSMPKDKFEFCISKITPISLAEEGVNYFRVEASLIRLSDKMLPGMEGVGKIEIREEKYYKIWSRNLVEWVKMFVWKWFA